MSLPIDDDLNESEAVAVTGRIRAWVKGCPIDDVQRAYFGRVWLAMGYESWDEWCDCELDGFKLPAPERKKVVAELAEAGMSNRAIADVVGCDEGTVRNDKKATAENSAVDRVTVGKDGKARKQPEPRPKPDVPEPEPKSQAGPDGWVVLENGGRYRPSTKEERDAVENAMFTPEQVEFNRYNEFRCKLGTARTALGCLLKDSKDVEFRDKDHIELLHNSLVRLRALIELIDLSISGEASIDWDAELQKITD